MDWHTKVFEGFSRDDENSNTNAIVNARASFCHPQALCVEGHSFVTPKGVDLNAFVSSTSPSLEDKLLAIRLAFECLSTMHERYSCLHLDAKANNFVVYCDRASDIKVYAIDFATMFRPQKGILKGANIPNFNHMAEGLYRYGYRHYEHYEKNFDIAYRYDVFSLATSLSYYLAHALPDEVTSFFNSAVLNNHTESIVEVLPCGKRVTHRTYLTDVGQPIMKASQVVASLTSGDFSNLSR